MLIYHLASLVTQPPMMRPVTLSTCKTILTPEQKAQTEATGREKPAGWLAESSTKRLVSSNWVTKLTNNLQGNSLCNYLGNSHFFPVAFPLSCSLSLVLLSSSVPWGFGTGQLAPSPFHEQPTTKISLQVAGLLFIIYQSVIWNANPCGICLGQGEITQADT